MVYGDGFESLFDLLKYHSLGRHVFSPGGFQGFSHFLDRLSSNDTMLGAELQSWLHHNATGIIFFGFPFYSSLPAGVASGSHATHDLPSLNQHLSKCFEAMRKCHEKYPALSFVYLVRPDAEAVPHIGARVTSYFLQNAIATGSFPSIFFFFFERDLLKGWFELSR